MPRFSLLRQCCLLLFVICCTNFTRAAEPPIELLWPNGAPGAKGEADKDKPHLLIYPAPAEKNSGAVVVVCPGGGYGGLAMGHEGHEIAAWFNERGITTLILVYRHKGTGYQHPTPLLDAQRAVRYARANAAKWKADPGKVGLMGFSAGGHLASSVGTHFDAGDPAAADPIDKVSCRPDYLMLMYPVITFGEFTHGGSKKNLLGDNPDPQLVEYYSNEKQVTDKTPPTFLFHTAQDTAVPAENSLLFYQALRRHKVPAELHIYETGGHGVGLAAKDPILRSWPDRLTDWLKVRGVLK